MLVHILTSLVEREKSTQSRDTFLALHFAARRLHGICENILYSRVYQQGRGHNRSLDLFLETILARPDLATKVKNFYTALYGTQEDVLGHHITPDALMDMVVKAKGGYSKDQLAQIRLAAENVYSSRNPIHSPYAMRNWELIIAYILMFLPNLEVVHCRGWVNLWPHILCPRSIESQNSVEEASVFGTFSKLKQVILEWHTDERMNNSRFDYFPWLIGRGKSPPVKSYSCISSKKIDHNFVVMSNDKSIAESQSLAKLGPTNITYYAPFDNGPLVFEFAASLPPLNRVCISGKFSHYQSSLVPHSLFKGLDHSRESLEHLAIIDNIWLPDPVQPGPSSFSHFINLKSLDVLAISMIVNFTETRHYRRWNYSPRGNWRLPKGDNIDRIDEDTIVKCKLVDQLVPALEALTLRRCVSCKKFDLFSNVFEMLEKKQQFVPNLRSLNLEWIQRVDGSLASHLGFTSEEAGELLLMCREVGIQMVMGVDDAQT